ncbi:hypothetical protein C7E19_24735, partial [Stenotrophomonas maltophilia]
HASLTGSARSENQAAISGLLGTLDDATLCSRAAALPANDPLYNFAGRALTHASLTGSARSENQAAISGLLGTLDDATLCSRA